MEESGDERVLSYRGGEGTFFGGVEAIDSLSLKFSG